MKQWIGFWTAFVLMIGGAWAQNTFLANNGTFINPTCVTQASSDNSVNCATTAFVRNGVTTSGVNITVNPYTPPLAFPGTQPFQINETITGTCTTTNNNCYFNFLNIPSDNAVVGSGTSGTFVNGIGFIINQNFGGAAMIGQRTGMTVSSTLTATTGNTAAHAQYSALNAFGTANANDNGTSTSLANSRGNVDAINFIAALGSAATNFTALQGGEVDVSMATGSSAYEKVGWQIVQLQGDAVRGAVYDAAIGIANQGGGTAPGWTNGILFGGLQGAWPFWSGSTIITCASPCGTATSFIDMSGATFSSNFLKGPQFSVSGTGGISSGSAGGTNGTLTLTPSSGAATTFTAFAGGAAFNGQFNVNQLNASGVLVAGAPAVNTGQLQLLGGTSGQATWLGSGTGGHVTLVSSSAPSLTGGCTGAGAGISGSDLLGTVGGQTAVATSCVVTFGTTFGAAPRCFTTGRQTPVTSYATTTSTLTINFASTAGATFDWTCYGT